MRNRSLYGYYTRHDSQPWADDSWRYDDDFCYDGYYEDMPAFLSKAKNAISSGIQKAGNAIEKKSNQITSGIGKGIQKAGNKIEAGSNKVTGAIGRGIDKAKGLFKKKPKSLTERAKEFGKSALKSGQKMAGKALKQGKKMAKSAGKWVKNNPVKAAAIAGVGLGAAKAAHTAVSSASGARDSMYGMTSFDSMPWVNKRKRDSALKRYIDRMIAKRIIDLGPGEFDPSVPLYNNRLPQARNMGQQHGPQELSPAANSARSQVVSLIKECERYIRDSLRSFITSSDHQILGNWFSKLQRDILSSDPSERRAVSNDIVKLQDYMKKIKQRFWEESPTWQGRFNPQLALEWKQQVNVVLKILDKISSISSVIGLK